MTETNKASSGRSGPVIPISWKLIGTTVIVALVAVGIAFSGLSRMQLLNDRMNRIVDGAAARVKFASLIKQQFVAITRAEKNMILAKSEEEMDRHVATIDRTLNNLEANVEKIRELANEDDQKSLDLFKERWVEWQSNHAELRDMTMLNSEVLARSLSVGNARKQIDALDSRLANIATRADTRWDKAIENQQLEIHRPTCVPASGYIGHSSVRLAASTDREKPDLGV